MQQQSTRQTIGRAIRTFCLLGLVVLGGALAWYSVQAQFVTSRPTSASSAPAATASLRAQAAVPTANATSPPAPTIAPSPTALAAAPRPAQLAEAPNVRVSAGRFTGHSEVTLARNPRNSQNMVGASKMFTDNASYQFRIGTYVTQDGGQTWTDNGHLPGLEQFEVTSDPVVAFDNAGTAYVEVLAATRGSRSASSLYLYKSVDGGTTWGQPLLVSDDARGFNDKQWLAVDLSGGPHDGNLYTAWVQIVDDTYRILFARSTDAGATWSEPRVLAADERVARQGPVVTVGSGGEVYVVWSNLSGSYFESSVSVDGGFSFTPPRHGLAFRNVDPLNGNLRRSFVLPALAADPRRPQTLYLVWDDGRLGDADVLFSRSTDGGATWQAPVVINGDTTNDQFQPWVAADANGEVFVQWFDRRDDPADLLVHTYAGRSTDGGVTWSELRVTNVASDPTVGLPLAGDAGFYGDYQALVADDTAVQLFWNETRDGQQEVYSASIEDEHWGLPYAVREAGPARHNRSPAPEAIENE